MNSSGANHRYIDEDSGSRDHRPEARVVTLPVSDVDRAKSFYQHLGWRLDADIVVGDVRGSS
jgi:hypothetical protein